MKKNLNFQLDIYLDGSKLIQVDNVLNLTLDKNLGWNVDHIEHKMFSGLYVLCQMYRVCNIDRPTLNTVYFSLIMSYGITVYGTTTKNNLDRFILQQNTVRIILNLNRSLLKNIFLN